MSTCLFVGGFKHGALEELSAPLYGKFVYEFPVQVQTKWQDTNTSVQYYQVVYLPLGTWSGHYGPIEVFQESTCGFVAVEASSNMALEIYKKNPKSIYVLSKSEMADICYALVDSEELPGAEGYKLQGGLFVPPGVEPPSTWKSQKESSPLTMATLNEILKKAYEEPLKYFIEKEQAVLAHIKAHEQYAKTKLYNENQLAWLNAGRRDATRGNLCFWCTEELIGPGMGMHNDFIVPKGKGSRVRKLACGNCGVGKFNRKGERIGDWEKRGSHEAESI